MNLAELNIELYADTADEKLIRKLCDDPLIKGFTTNPSLLCQANISDYESFARHILKIIKNKPIFFEVIADDFITMEDQARMLAALGSNVSVKIPITSTQGEFTGPLIKRLSHDGIPINITVVMTLTQVEQILSCLNKKSPTMISILAGRIADTGINPVPIVAQALQMIKHLPNVKLLWASTRELFNIMQANEMGCHAITLPHDVLDKLTLVGKDLQQYSLEIVQMYFNEAQKARYQLGESVEA